MTRSCLDIIHSCFYTFTVHYYTLAIPHALEALVAGFPPLLLALPVIATVNIVSVQVSPGRHR